MILQAHKIFRFYRRENVFTFLPYHKWDAAPAGRSLKTGLITTEQLFRERRAIRLPSAIQRVALRKLVQIDAVSELRHLAIPPGNRLEALKRDRAGQHSIRINNQWRVCFAWRGHDAYDVEIVDYH